MKILRADYILICNDEFEVLRDQAICFDEKIKELGEVELLKSKYPDASFEDLGQGSLLMPGLINVHVHLEFSANESELSYGDFIPWLQSVVLKRDDLLDKCAGSCIDDALSGMLESGITTIGAISSFGVDLEPCVKSPINVVYFNEVLGSNPAAVDALYADFHMRLQDSKKYKSSSFIPAISVHSPYSTHPILAKKVLRIAKDEDMIVSTHFMESNAEREWLDHGKGDFVKFFEPFSSNAKPVNTPVDYISLFKDIKTLFTHATKANKEELDLLQSFGVITHCPRSNRLLGNGRLEIENIDTFTLATDGLSSNDSLSLWDEMRAALNLHHQAPLEKLSKRLLKSVTKDAAFSMGLNKGVLQSGKDSDLAIFKLPEDVSTLELSTILLTKKASCVYIGGKKMI